MTAWIVVTVVSKSSTSWLIETFITDWSSTMTNCAVASATKGAHRIAEPVGTSVSALPAGVVSVINRSLQPGKRDGLEEP